MSSSYAAVPARQTQSGVVLQWANTIAVIVTIVFNMLPQALPIGAVERVISQDVETTQQAIVRPGVDFDGLEVVLVITRPRAAQALPSTPAPPVR